MTRTAKKMFKDIGYKYSEKYITDNITNEKVLEQIQYEKGVKPLGFISEVNFGVNHIKILAQNMITPYIQRWKKQRLLFNSVKN